MPPPEQQTPSPAGGDATPASGEGLDRTTGRCGSPRRVNASINAIAVAPTAITASSHFVQATEAIVIGSAIALG